MAIIRPVLNDFSAGELSPRLAGMMNSPLYARGAGEMTNFLPARLGGAYRRGGLKYVADTPVASSKTRLIPWSVNDDLDLLVVLTDGEIRLFNASAGTVAEYITSPMLPITDLGDGTAAYAEADIFDVKYAQSISEIVMVHKDYSPFHIKILSYDTSTLALELEFGVIGFEGNIAYSPVLKGDVIDLDTPFVSTDITSRLTQLVAGQSYAADGYIGSKHVSSVMKIANTVQESAKLYAKTWNGEVDTTIYRTTGNIPSVDYSLYAGPVYFEVRRAEGAATEFSAIVYDDRATPSTKTCAQLLDACYTLMGDNNATGVYCAYYTDNILYGKAKGSIYYTHGGTTYTYRITFSDSSTLTLDPNTPQTLFGYFTMTYPAIIVNKNVIAGTAFSDRISPWMVPEVAYPCDGNTKFCGGYPVSAVRHKGGKLYNTAGELMSDSDPYILVNMQDGGVVVIKRGDTGLTGQLGVIVTPFYWSGDNPSVVAFHQGRLVLGGSAREPNVLYMSKAGDTSNFCYFDEVEFEATSISGFDGDTPIYTTRSDITQQIGASSAIRIQLATEENEEIRSLTSVSDLLVQTATSEWVVPFGITALNPQVVLRGRLGASNVQGRFVGDSVFSVSRTGKRIRAFSPSQGAGQDITEHAEHIAASGVTSIDFRQDPDSEVVAVLADGTLLVGTPSQDVIGWSRIRTDGGIIESAVCLSAYDEDALYCVVKRTINSVDYRFIERLITPDDSTFLKRAYLDCYQTGTTTSGIGTVSGLTRFIGADEVWIVLADGTEGELLLDGAGAATQYQQTSEEDPTNLPAATQYIVGFRSTARLKTVRLDSAQTEGYDKSGAFAYIRLYKSGNIHIVRYDDDGLLDNDAEIVMPNAADGTRRYPFSGAIKVDYLSPASSDASIIIESHGGESAGIQVVAPSLNVAAIEES